MELKRVIQIPIKVSKQARGVSLEDVLSLENEFPIGDCPYSPSSNFFKNILLIDARDHPLATKLVRHQGI